MKARKRYIFIVLFSLMFLSISGGGNSDINESQEIISETYSAQAETETAVVIAVEISPVDTTYHELQAQNGRIAEQIEKADEIDKELEGIIEQLKKED